ncbi:MAG: hypothetical protein JO267_10650, partial [Alphaproteobacteria bacterium]|nr:hypothetical protein [Alphaproteobacteria bacterium]
MATDAWQNPGTSGNWSTGANWSQGHPPNTGEDVVLGNSSTAYTVTLDVNSNALPSLEIGQGSDSNAPVTFDVGAQTLDVNRSISGGTRTITLEANNTGPNILNIEGGTITAASLVLQGANQLTPQNGYYVAELFGYGTLSVASITGMSTGITGPTYGYVGAQGGTLTITGNIAQNSGIFFSMGPNSVLQLDGTVGQGNDFTFDGFSGAVLGLGNDTGFDNTLYDMSVSSGASPINYVDVEGHTVTITGESGEGTTSGTITLSDGTTLTLQQIGSALWYPHAISDGSSGTKIFLTNSSVDSWENPGTSGNWSVGSNWSTGASPTFQEDAVLGNYGSPYTVTLDVNTPALDSLTIGQGSASNAPVTLDIGAETLNVTGTGSGATDTITLDANNTGPNELYIEGGTIEAAKLVLQGANQLTPQNGYYVAGLFGYGTLSVASITGMSTGITGPTYGYVGAQGG